MGPMTFGLHTVDEKKSHYFQQLLADVHRKLKHDPTELTTEDARRLSENVDINDRRAALIVTAVESYVIGNEAMHEVDSSLGQAPHTSLSTILNDLKFAVELNPHDVTQDHMRTAQEIVSKMHRVNKPVAAIHPELEAELKEEIAKIEPKVAQGTVTVDEANHLHSLEARAHGHTEKGGITSLAQSVAAKRERQLSLSSGSTLPSTSRSRSNSTAYTSQQQSHDGREINQPKAEYATKPKTEQGTGGHPQPSISEDRRKQALSNSSNVAPYTATKEEFKQRQEQSQHEKVVNLKIAEMTMGPKGKNEPNDTTTDDVVV